MRIGIDGRSLNTKRAMARYTKNLLNQLAKLNTVHEFFLFVQREERLSEVAGLKLLPNWKIIPSPVKLVLRDHFFFRRFLAPFQLDVFFHPDNTEFLFCHPKSVVTIHDLIPHLYPEWVLSRNPILRARQRLYVSLQASALKRSARHIITVSQNSKKDIEREFGISSPAISVTYEAAQENFYPRQAAEIYEVKKKLGIVGDYIFCNSAFFPYKNVLAAIDSFATIAKRYPDLKMVLCGVSTSLSMGNKDYYDKVLRRGEYLGLSTRIIFVGFVGDDVLPALYSGATLFLYPSFYEGFGIPLLEAQACGVPVATSDVSSIPEVVGKSAFFFDPSNVEQMTSRIEDLLENQSLRRELIEQGFENVKKFSWEKCARQTLEVLEKIAGAN